MRVALTNAAALNTGDAAIMLAIERHLELAFGDAVDLTVYDNQHRDAARYYPEIHFAAPIGAALLRVRDIPWLGWRLRTANLARWDAAARVLGRARWLARLLLRPAELRKLDELAEADLVLSTGGTYLVEHYSPWARLAELAMLEHLDAPVVLCTQSLGPFTTPELRWRMREVVDGSARTLLRDERSERNLLELGVDPTRTQVSSDVVFTFAREDRAVRPPAALRRVAVSVRSWDHGTRDDGGAAYVSALRALLTHLVRDRGVAVTMLSTCQGIPEYWTDDSAFAAEVVGDLPPDVRTSVAVDRDFHHPLDLRARLADFDLVVSTRMHMAILALCSGTPVLPIAYEFKTKELFERLGLGRHVQDIDALDGDDLVRALVAFLEDAEGVEEALTSGVDRERATADEAVAVLRAVVR